MDDEDWEYYSLRYGEPVFRRRGSWPHEVLWDGRQIPLDAKEVCYEMRRVSKDDYDRLLRELIVEAAGREGGFRACVEGIPLSRAVAPLGRARPRDRLVAAIRPS